MCSARGAPRSRKSKLVAREKKGLLGFVCIRTDVGSAWVWAAVPARVDGVIDRQNCWFVRSMVMRVLLAFVETPRGGGVTLFLEDLLSLVYNYMVRSVILHNTNRFLSLFFLLRNSSPTTLIFFINLYTVYTIPL